MPDRVAVITGASSGFGLLTAVELARQGWTVVATMRDLARREALENAARAAGANDRIHCLRLDINETASIPGFVAAIVRDHGRIDALINNAGFAMSGFAEDMRLEEIRQQFDTNFFGHVAMSQAVLPTMRAQRSGHIVMVSSISGLVGQPVVGSYSASKFALEGWSETLRIETHSLGIRVVLVEPGAFKTDIWSRNVKVGSFAISPESPNHDRARRFSDFVKTKVPKRDPQEVVRLITRIVNDPNPRLRYRIGTDAHIQLWLKRLLPWKTFERMVAKMVKID
jgi:NAD(P)-dependent dehydrogenase (short-subunit alcohol dehydrogenase family)